MSNNEYVTKTAVMMIIEQQGAKIKELQKENAKLKERLKEAENVIEFYAYESDAFDGYDNTNDFSVVYVGNLGVECLGKKAREYLEKWGG